MKKRFEEDLAKLAFGDLNAAEAQRLELLAMKDPEATRALDSYCRMKDELKSLAVDVPDDQLSTDRLRQAILARGLGDRRPVARFNWVWMPATAAVLAFGFMFAKSQFPLGNGAPTVVVDRTTSSPMLSIPKIVTPEPPARTALVPRNDRRSIVSDGASTVVVMNESRTSRARRNTAGMGSRSRADDVALPGGAEDLTFANRASSEGLGLATKPMDFGGRDLATMAAPAPSGPASSHTILVIQPETDSTTGTHRATEVDSTANVIVGG